MEFTPYQRNLIASLTGGFFTGIIVCPLDVIKTRIQAQPEAPFKVMKDAITARYGQPCLPHQCTHFRSATTYEAFRIIVEYEGVRALWKGLTPTLLLTIPGVTLYYSLYEKFFSQTKSPFLSGSLARTLSTFVISPLDMFKTYVQSKKDSLRYSSLLRDIYRKRGLSGFWIGLGPTLMRDVPFSATYWSIYDRLGTYLWPHTRGDGSARPFIGNFLTGATAGTIASVITLPADVIKTRQQMMIDADSLKAQNLSKGNPPSCLPTLRCTVETLYEAEGLRGFFRGLAPKVMRTAPACAIMISTYQFVKSVIKVKEENVS